MVDFTFVSALALILHLEGGDQYTNIPGDPGRGTRYGVTQLTYDTWRDEQGKPRRSVRFIEMPEVEAIYEEKYWRAAKCHLLPSPLNLIVFDQAVNQGVGRAVRTLQAAVGVEADGHLGPVTLRAVVERPLAKVVRTLRRLRRDSYLAISLARAKAAGQKVGVTDAQYAAMRSHGFQFTRGWLNRLDTLYAALEDDHD